MFFTFKILPLIGAFVVLLCTFPMRSFVDPSSLISEISGFIGIDALLVTCACEIAGVMVDEEPIRKVRLIVVTNFAFIVASKISIFFKPVDFYVALWKLL